MVRRVVYSLNFDKVVRQIKLIDNNSRKEAFVAERTDQIFSATDKAILATLINAPILTYVLWPVVEHKNLLIWLVAIVCLSLVRLVFLLRYKKAKHLSQNARLWSRWYLLGSLSAAGTWAAPSIWLFPETDIARQVFLAFVVGGMGAGAITTLSHMRRAINSFLFISLTPLIFRFYTSESELSLSMGTMLTLHLVMCLIAANRSHINIKQNILLQIDLHEKEQSLQNSEQRYKTILEKVTDAFFLHDAQGRFLEVNQQACINLGYSRDELLNMSVADIETDREAVELNQLWRTLKLGETTIYEGIHRRKDGTTFPIEASVGWVEIDGNNLISISVRDISERKQAESFLQAKTAQLETVISKAPLILWSADKNGIFTFSDGLALRGLGLKPGEVVGRSVFDLYKDYPEIIEASRRAVSGEASISNISEIAGHYYEAHYAPSHNEHGEVTGSIGVALDITERILAEQQIKELARFPEEALSPIFKVSANGVLSYANPASDLIKTHWQIEVGGKVPKDFYRLVSNTIENESPQEHILHCSDKIFFTMLVPILELDAVYVYGLDITRQQNTQAELKKHKDNLEEMVAVRTHELIEATELAKQASKAKSLFLSNMSHEIRTPLSAIIGFTEILSEDKKINSEHKESIATLLASSHHLQEIISDILDFSKIEANKLDIEILSINLREQLREIETLVRHKAEKKGLLLRINIADDVPEYFDGDSVRMKQILLNLSSNAIKFTQDGEVRLNVELSENGEKLFFKVIDTGIGMTSDQMAKLFQPFLQADSSITRKFGGTGLGLTISRQLAELLGGSLEVISDYGKGSQFELILPVHNNAAVTKRENVVQPLKPKATGVTQLRGRVLLVEDTESLQNLIGLFLSRIGLEYEIAENGKIALEKASRNNFDLILMDIQMPIMGGIEATKKLRESQYSKPIVALTANALEKDKDECLNAGCNDFVTKPINRDRLYNVASHYLGMAASN